MDDIFPETYKTFNFGKWFSESGGFFLLFGSLFIVIGAVFFWAAVIRKRRDRYTSHRERHRDDHRPRSNPGEDSSKGPRVRRRKRRSSHPRYPKNPTLAETGGLPPIRRDEGAEPPGWPGN
jgi:hypothetical protein